MKRNFYNDAPIIYNFRHVTDESGYIPVPESWHVVAGDIRNSTKAIESGKYKQVNMAGASLIAAISNIFRDEGDLPFSIGGDGAIILIPNNHLSEVQSVLSYCRLAVRENFGLELITGILPVQQIIQAGYSIKVAKLELSDTIHQTLFWGDGIAYAEDLIKQTEQPELEITPEELENYSIFEGLECRWKEIPPEHDEITSFIIKAGGVSLYKKAEVYDSCLEKIREVYGSLDDRNPLQNRKLTFTKNLRKLMVEWKMRTWKPTLKRRIQYGLKLVFQIFVGQYLMWRKTITKNTDWGRYKSDLVKHADFRKFDDALKFVISGTEDQRKKMEQFLENERKAETLHYGIHSSKSLIITCYIKNYHKHHVHFVDGSDGGYALAAKKLKLQMAGAETEASV